MRKTIVTLIAVCATLLWVGAVHASNAGGLPACQASLNLSNQHLATCQSELTTAQLCGNDVIDPGEQCDQSNLNGKTCADVGFKYGTLKCGANCQFDTSGCTSTRFVDNGDGTITDNQIGLMWEKKTGTIGTANLSDVHDVNNTYTWTTGFTSFLATLNNGASTDGGATTAITGCFAKYCDWRLPSIVELQGIVDSSATGCGSGSGSACIDPIFGSTQLAFYWTGTTLAASSNGAWHVDFAYGDLGFELKTVSPYVRAVRSGL